MHQQPYRAEIDGLRALSVIAVVLFHAEVGAFRGGFVGVDVFFVISGYLIGKMLLNDFERNTYSIFVFYERRARRILPALFLVISCSCILAWQLLMPDQLRSFADSVLSVLAFMPNLYFWRNTEYFDVSAELLPLLHTWSLGVEEQFYIVFPLMLALCTRARVRNLPLVLGAALLLSFALGLWATRYYPKASFFWMLPRAWELLAGAWIAAWAGVADARWRGSRGLRESAVCVGLALIFGSMLLLDETTPFPSYWAAIPVGGAALVIYFSAPGLISTRVLSARPLVFVGLLSYSVYLWHQPLLAFLRHYAISKPTAIDTWSAILLSFVLGYLTWRFVERPFRNVRRMPRSMFTLSCGGWGVALAAIAIYLASHQGHPERLGLPQTVSDALRITARSQECFDIPQAHLDGVRWNCEVDPGALGKAPAFLVLGDSHAQSFLPALERAARELAIQGLFAGFSACPPLLDVHPLTRSDTQLKDCRALNARALAHVRVHKIPIVVLIGRWSWYTDPGYAGSSVSYVGKAPDDARSLEVSRQTIRRALRRTIEQYREAGARVVVVEQIPLQRFESAAVYRKLYASGDAGILNEFSVDHATHRRITAAFREMTREVSDDPSVTILDLDELYCKAGLCTIGTPETPHYRDKNHLSDAGAGLAVTVFKRTFQAHTPDRMQVAN